jgi:hypothetical protein
VSYSGFLLFSHVSYALMAVHSMIPSYVSAGVIFLYFAHCQFIPSTGESFLLELYKYIINCPFRIVTLLPVFSPLEFSLKCCYPNRISYIVMIGQVLQLLGCTSNSMFIMVCQMAGLYSPSTILNLEHIKLAKQWHIVIRLQL